MNRIRRITALVSMLILVLTIASCRSGDQASYDIVIKNGTVYDGSGDEPFKADVGIKGDRIVRIGSVGTASARKVIEAKGLAVAPGFVNMMSWSNETLIEDGNSQSDVRQGVTTQILGEGHSMGPLTPDMKRRMEQRQGDLRYPVTWTTLAEYLGFLEGKGVSQNVASFVGAATVREYAVGLEDREPTPEEMELMRSLVRSAMEAGALGVSTALIYAPGSYAKTGEIVELAKVSAEFGGIYISHLRSEGNALEESVGEFLQIARAARIPAEIYHLKAAGQANWPKMDNVIRMVEEARREGLKITADMYTYTAGSTGLEACIPLWAQSGGSEAMRERFRDPAQRQRILRDMKTPSQEWENFYLLAGSPERILLVGFKKEELKPLQGMTLGEVARMREKDPAEVILDLLSEDESRVGAVYFLMSEDNVRKQIALPWVSFCSDSPSMAPEGSFLKISTHPRAYGSFARLLARYVRDENVIPLQEAVRRLAKLPAENLGLEGRGSLQEGMFADVVVFDPVRIQDRATFEQPHQYSVGVHHVLVNGILVLENGEHTGARPGRALRRGR